MQEETRLNKRKSKKQAELTLDKKMSKKEIKEFFEFVSRQAKKAKSDKKFKIKSQGETK